MNDMSEVAEVKHSTGPWEVVCSNGYSEVVQQRSKASVCDVLLFGGIGEANARLIAAAPELCAACELAARFIQNGVEYGYITMPEADTPDPAHDTLPAIIKALAKARGETL